MQRAINAQSNTYVLTLRFYMNIAGIQAISLINHIVQNLVGTHQLKGLRNSLDCFAVSLFGNLNIVILNLFGGIVSHHKITKTKSTDQAVINRSAIIVIGLC